MGWQGSDPSTDFRYMGKCIFDSHSSFVVSACAKILSIMSRGGGFISLENLIYFAKTYPVCTSYNLCCHYSDWNWLFNRVPRQSGIYMPMQVFSLCRLVNSAEYENFPLGTEQKKGGNK